MLLRTHVKYNFCQIDSQPVGTGNDLHNRSRDVKSKDRKRSGKSSDPDARSRSPLIKLTENNAGTAEIKTNSVSKNHIGNEKPSCTTTSHSTMNSSVSSLGTEEYNIYVASSSLSQQSGGYSRRYYVPFCHSSEEGFDQDISGNDLVDPCSDQHITSKEQSLAVDQARNISREVSEEDRKSSNTESYCTIVCNQETQTSSYALQKIQDESTITDNQVDQETQTSSDVLRKTTDQSATMYSQLDLQGSSPKVSRILGTKKELSTREQVFSTPVDETKNSLIVTKSLSNEERTAKFPNPSLRSLIHEPDVDKHHSCEELIALEAVSSSVQNLKWALNLPKALSFDMVEQNYGILQQLSGTFRVF